MPIASGASGRVDIGAADGQTKKAMFASRSCDSYLQRYQEIQRRKRNSSTQLHGTQGSADAFQEIEGDKEDDGDEDEEGKTSGKPSKGGRLRKSQLCVIF